MSHSTSPVAHPSNKPLHSVQTSDVVSDQYVDSLTKFNEYYNLFLKQYNYSPEYCMNSFKINNKQVVFGSKIITGKQAKLIQAFATVFLFKSITPPLYASRDSKLPQKSKPKTSNSPLAKQEKPLKKEDSTSKLDLPLIDHIPDELLTLVLQQIPKTWLDVSKLALTSKHFYQITRTSTFLKAVFQYHPSISRDFSSTTPASVYGDLSLPARIFGVHPTVFNRSRSYYHR